MPFIYQPYSHTTKTHGMAEVKWMTEDGVYTLTHMSASR